MRTGDIIESAESDRIKVYLDTSVVSHLFQDEDPERQADSAALWKMFKQGTYEAYLSDATLNEIDACDEPQKSSMHDKLFEIDFIRIRVTDEVNRIANKIVDAGVLKARSFVDCQHIAAAIIAGCDCIASWNFKHLVNYKTINGIRSITIPDGFKNIDILSPSSLIETEE